MVGQKQEQGAQGKTKKDLAGFSFDENGGLGYPHVILIIAEVTHNENIVLTPVL